MDDDGSVDGDVDSAVVASRGVAILFTKYHLLDGI